MAAAHDPALVSRSNLTNLIVLGDRVGKLGNPAHQGGMVGARRMRLR